LLAAAAASAAVAERRQSARFRGAAAAAGADISQLFAYSAFHVTLMLLSGIMPAAVRHFLSLR
jgi:hypothetical protein